MTVHLVGLTRPATLRLSHPIRFRGVGRVRGKLDRSCALDEQSFAAARIDCQAGANAKTGEMCFACPRLLDYEAGVRPGEIVVTCAWTHDDPVSARMTAVRALVSVPSEMPCAEAELAAAQARVRRLLVIDGGYLVGIVSRSDLAAGARARSSVCSVMAGDVFAIAASATLGEAAAAMRALNIGCLPVVRGGLLVGILTRGDLRRAGLAEPTEAPGEP